MPATGNISGTIPCAGGAAQPGRPAIVVSGPVGVRRRSLRQGLVLTVSALGGLASSYGRAFAGSCVPSGTPGTYLCSGPASGGDTTQSLNFSGSLTNIVTAPGFGITTASGDAFQLNGTGSFADAYGATITGAGSGIALRSNTAGDISITSTGNVTGQAGDGVSAYIDVGTSATNLNISGNTITGQGDGINITHFAGGTVSITATGTVTGQTGVGIYDREVGGASTGVTVNAAAVYGHTEGIQIYFMGGAGGGPINITTTGKVIGGAWGIITNSGSATTDINVSTAEVQGGISINNNGTGGINIHAAGAASGGTDRAGIGAFAGSTTSGGVTISAAAVSGAYDGIIATNAGTGSINITATGDVTTSRSRTLNAYSADGIFAINNSSGGGGITIKAGNVSGYGAGVFARNYGTGPVSITTTGAVSSWAYDNALAGIHAEAHGGAITIDQTGANGSVSGGFQGVAAYEHGDGAISITTTGSISPRTTNYSAHYGDAAVVAYSTGNSPITITDNAAITPSPPGGEGIHGNSGILITKKGTGAGDINLAVNAPITDGGVFVSNAGTGMVRIVAAANMTGGISIGVSQPAPASVDVQAGAVLGGGVGIASGNAPASLTNEGVISGGVELYGSGATITNNGIIGMAGRNGGIQTGANGTINLQSGAVLGNAALIDGGNSVLNWTGGSFSGDINMQQGSTANLTGLSAADLAGLEALSGNGAQALNLRGIIASGGTDESSGIQVNGWNNISLLDHSSWTLTGGLTMGGA